MASLPPPRQVCDRAPPTETADAATLGADEPRPPSASRGHPGDALCWDSEQTSVAAKRNSRMLTRSPCGAGGGAPRRAQAAGKDQDKDVRSPAGTSWNCSQRHGQNGRDERGKRSHRNHTKRKCRLGKRRGPLNAWGPKPRG